MNLLRIGLMAAVAASLSAPATAKTEAPKLYNAVTVADMRAIAQAEGHTPLEGAPFVVPSVSVKTASGVILVLSGFHCDVDGQPGCQSLLMQVRYNDDKRVTLENLNKANSRDSSLVTWQDSPNNAFGFSRVIILKGGVTMQNLRENMRWLLNAMPASYAVLIP